MSLQRFWACGHKNPANNSYSGCGCSLLAYDHANYGGRSLLIKQQNANFGNDYFNDRLESAIIQGNCQWLLYRDHLFLGNSHLLSPGYYPSAVSWGGVGNHITSARALPPRGMYTKTGQSFLHCSIILLSLLFSLSLSLTHTSFSSLHPPYLSPHPLPSSTRNGCNSSIPTPSLSRTHVGAVWIHPPFPQPWL